MDPVPHIYDARFKRGTLSRDEYFLEACKILKISNGTSIVLDTWILGVLSPVVQVGPLRGTSAPGCHALISVGRVRSLVLPRGPSG